MVSALHPCTPRATHTPASSTSSLPGAVGGGLPPPQAITQAGGTVGVLDVCETISRDRDLHPSSLY